MTFLIQQLSVHSKDSLALNLEAMATNFMLLQFLESGRGSSCSLAGQFFGVGLVAIFGSSAQVCLFSSASDSVNYS